MCCTPSLRILTLEDLPQELREDDREAGTDGEASCWSLFQR